MYNFVGDNMNEVNEEKKEVTGEIIINQEKKEKKINLEKYNLLTSVIFLIFGAILTTNPGEINKIINFIIGGILIVIGIIKIILFIHTKKKYQIIRYQDIISGIILCILGITACIMHEAVETLIRIIVGAWILYSGISSLIFSIKLEHKFNIKSPLLILSLIIIIIGICTIMIKYIGFQVMGIMILLYSITDIISYILKQK